MNIDIYINILNYFDFKLDYIQKKIISSFFIDIYNKSDIQDSYNLYIKKFGYNINIYNKVKQLQIQCKFINNDHLLYIIKYKINDLKIKKIKYKIHPNLLNLIDKSNINNFYKLNLYYMILNIDESGQFWGFGPDIYNKLKLNHKNIIECFTSLFNKSLDNFYSLLEIETEYGSKGNFFDHFLNDNYDYYVINPPYIESILLKVFELIYKKLLIKNDIIIYLLLPIWNDIINTFTSKLKYYKLYNFYQVYDYYSKKIVQKQKLYFIIVSNYNKNFNELYKLIINN